MDCSTGILDGVVQCPDTVQVDVLLSVNCKTCEQSKHSYSVSIFQLVAGGAELVECP